MTDILLSRHQSPAANLLEAGIAAARTGQELRAWHYLRLSITLDPKIAETWVWLAKVAPSPRQREAYLQCAQAISLPNQRAQSRLHRTEQHLNSPRRQTYPLAAAAKRGSMQATAALANSTFAQLLARGQSDQLTRRLEELFVGGAYLLAIVLAEAVTRWGDSRLGLVLQGLILLSVLYNAAFGREDKTGRILLVLALIPLFRIISLSLPLGYFHPPGQDLADTAPLLAAMVRIITPFDVALDPARSTSVSTVAVVLLITFIILKELISTLEGRWQAFEHSLKIAIVPLLITFFITVVIRIIDILG